MFQSRYWLWHIKDDQEWSQTNEHERWDGIKLYRPEAMPVLGTMILHGAPLPSDVAAFYESLEPDVPF
ncbi:hypothetical protein EDF71_11221 [Comamonas sp. JUb58]|nr:hypothetical protein EDF71_11221 [Comamonas sp. JUb58]